jgi:hypothetical protein
MDSVSCSGNALASPGLVLPNALADVPSRSQRRLRDASPNPALYGMNRAEARSRRTPPAHYAGHRNARPRYCYSWRHNGVG